MTSAAERSITRVIGSVKARRCKVNSLGASDMSGGYNIASTHGRVFVQSIEPDSAHAPRRGVTD